MWPFKRKKESPEEIAAEKRLDDVTREAAWGEFDKEAAHETGMGPFAPLGMTGATEGPLKGDPDPTDEHGLRETLHESDEKS